MPCPKCGSCEWHFHGADKGDIVNPPEPAYYACVRCGHEDGEDAQAQYDDGHDEYLYEQARQREIDGEE